MSVSDEKTSGLFPRGHKCILDVTVIGLTSENVKRLKDDVMTSMGKHLAAQNLATEDADNMLEEVISDDEEAIDTSRGRQKHKKRKKFGKS